MYNCYRSPSGRLATARWMNGGQAGYLKDASIFDSGKDKNE